MTKYVVPAAGVKGKIPVRCDNPTCIDAVRLRKNARIKETHLRMYANGTKTSGWIKWAGFRGVSPEELLMADWFTKRGWEGQFHITTGLASCKGNPNFFFLDFAHAKKHLYVEIDGSSHNIPEKKKKDDRKDRILADLGWAGIRIPASLVSADLKAAKALVMELIQSKR